jgi:hypothetical protein
MSEDNEGKVLSQSDIDAMLSTVPQDPDPPKSKAPAATAQKPPTADIPAQAAAAPAAKPAAPAAAAPAAKPASANAASSGQQKSKEVITLEIIESLQATLADLIKRLAKMEHAMERLELLEEKVGEMGASSGAPSGELQKMKDHVQELNGQMDEISGNLKYSLGYGVGKIFQCKHCESKNLVALHVKCTECGEENWLGWWPKRS